VGHGNIKYSITEAEGRLYIEGLVSDRGRGIANLDEIKLQPGQPIGGKGWGIYNSCKLVEVFAIESENEKGTKVSLRKVIPHHHPVINQAVIKSWVESLKNDGDISPYAEIKSQNMQLLELLDQIKEKNLEVENQLAEITRLNSELQTSNQEITGLLQERNKSNELLISINLELDKFAHIVSHDLKAPLYNIYSLATIIEEEVPENNLAEISKTVGMIKKQAGQMEKFISDVLLYSTAGRQTIAKEEVDLVELLQSIVKTLTVPPNFEIKIQSDFPQLFTEKIYLQQIFSNLISNAIKYNDKPAGRIDVNFKYTNNFLQFEVADNGPGIPLNEQERIFKAYETGSKHRNTSTGLGLSIIDKIIQLKKAAFWVESKGTDGASFKFTWPVADIRKPEIAV
jgi:signal transduction histidine kinase